MHNSRRVVNILILRLTHEENNNNYFTIISTLISRIPILDPIKDNNINQDNILLVI